jgi:hypothetical protein
MPVARPTSVSDLAVLRRLYEVHMDFPFAGSRMLRDLFAADAGQDAFRRRLLAIYSQPQHLSLYSLISEYRHSAEYR